MKKYYLLISVFAALIASLAFAAQAHAGETRTITGKTTDSNSFLDEGPTAVCGFPSRSATT